jgi:hypothetical protein
MSSEKISKTKSSFLFWGLFILLSNVLYAQNDIDILRYSQQTFTGSARYSSMAGAFGALGGDFSCLSANPAGIAVFRKSDFSFTPTIFYKGSSSNYYGKNSEDYALNFNFGNIGIVGVFKNPNAKDGIGWLNFNAGIGYNRSNSFRSNTTMSGQLNQSLLDGFTADAQGLITDQLNPFGNKLAFNTYLIDTVGGPTKYQSIIPLGSTLEQRKYVNSRGATGEVVISFGGNYSNMFYLGGSVGIASIRYSEEAAYSESDVTNSIKEFNSFTYTNTLSTRGRGVNVKIGGIYKPADWLRLGVGLHTPTYYSLSDDYSSTMLARTEHYVDTSDAKGDFDYSLLTPGRMVGSVALVLGKHAILSCDAERVNYAGGKLNAPGNVFQDVNVIVQQKYKAALNLRAGGELRLDRFALRLGYALYGSPFANDKQMQFSKTGYTFGLGYRTETRYVDVAFVNTQYKEAHYLYSSPTLLPATNNYAAVSLMCTVGFRF